MTDPGAVAEAIREAAAAADLVLVTRGGGEGIERLDNEQVLLAAGSCPVPIVVACGHADDYLLLERVADRAFPTPTAAGAWLRTVLRERQAERVRAQEAQQVAQAGTLAKAVEGMQAEITALRVQVSQAHGRAQALAGTVRLLRWAVLALALMAAVLAARWL